MSVKRNAALGFIFITVLIDIIGLGVIIPVLPKLISQLTGGGISDAAIIGGWLTFAYAIMQFFFSPILGGLSDRFGRRPVLLIALLGLGIDYIFMAFAPTIAWLFIGRIIAGISGASISTATAYIADISTPEKRAQNFGLIGAAFGLGFIIGPVIGGIFSQYGTHVPFLIAAGLSLLNVIYGYFVLPESLLAENKRAFDWKRANPFGSLKHLKKYPVVSGLVVSYFLINIGSHAVQSNWTYYTMLKFNWDEKMVGYSLGFVGIVVSIVQGGLIRKINPALGNAKSVYLGFSLFTIGMVLYAFATETWMMFAIIVPYAFGGIGTPALQGIISSEVPANAQGELQGALTSVLSLTSIIGPLLMNNLFAYFTSSKSVVYFPGAPFIMAAILIGISLLLAYRSLHLKAKQ